MMKMTKLIIIRVLVGEGEVQKWNIDMKQKQRELEGKGSSERKEEYKRDVSDILYLVL